MADSFEPRALARRDLRRLVSEMWTDERCDPVAASVLDAAVACDAKSVDRAVVTAYLRHFPKLHPDFERLRAASEMVATRRDWPWRSRGETWRLWDASAGPARLAAALLSGEPALHVMRDVGLEGDLAQGEFIAAALEAACDKAADAEGEAAISAGSRLIALFEQLSIADLDAVLAWALLVPWTKRNPPDAYRDKLTKLLVARIGDPRLNAARWDAVAAEMKIPEAQQLVAMMRRWLTNQTVREFFKVVTHTTKDLVQWREREAFWLPYLDAEAITDAWFALGSDAAQIIQSKSDDALGACGRITGDRQYADPSHSSLILSIGDVRIAEWSHSGACRFWQREDRSAPEPYKAEYFGYQLRAMNGGDGFEHVSHFTGWQRRFAYRIYKKTGVRHPVYGEGHA